MEAGGAALEAGRGLDGGAALGEGKGAQSPELNNKKEAAKEDAEVCKVTGHHSTFSVAVLFNKVTYGGQHTNRECDLDTAMESERAWQETRFLT